MGFPQKCVFPVVLFLSLFPLQASDVKDLEATFEQALEDLSRKDFDGFLSSWHSEAVLFARNRIHPIDRAQLEDRAWRELFEDFFARIISIGYTQKAVQFRVIGDTGIVWGLTRLAIDGRYGEGSDQETRLTVVFVKVGEEWKIIQWNNAPGPTDLPPVIR